MALKTPDRIKPLSKNWKDNSWKDYTPAELGQWVALLIKRASHRKGEKALKDLDDATNYLKMLEAHIWNGYDKYKSSEE